SMMLNFVFQTPPSLFITAMSVVTLVSLANVGYMETKGKHLRYSKFWNVNMQKSESNQIKLSSRTGLLITLTPAFLASVASFQLFPDEGQRFLLLKSALTIHFYQEDIRGAVHKYSGKMFLGTAILSFSYFMIIATIVYSQHLAQGFPEPLVDLSHPGILLFFIGISGNFYHHYLLSKILRGKDDKEYKIPMGGLFGLVICPHYLFEILMFLGISLISQTLYPFFFTIGCSFYMMGRSYAARRWYLSKFEDFPKDLKSLVPYVF
ncbi:LOW QUALITY PROTEIN: Steroid_dh domain-containing protein, partial [Cephalotus follicularis]